MNTCQYTWRLAGETREVQCRLPEGHDVDYHVSGIHAAPTKPVDLPALSSLHDIRSITRRTAFRDTLRPGRFR